MSQKRAKPASGPPPGLPAVSTAIRPLPIRRNIRKSLAGHVRAHYLQTVP